MIKKANKVMNIEEAISLIKDGDAIMVGGFGLRGAPDDLIQALVESNKKDLTIISNDLGSPGVGLGKLLDNNQIKACIGNYYNWNPDLVKASNEGRVEVKLIPQGSFAEAIRAGGVGIPAFYTPASAGTELGKGKETRNFDNREFVLQEALTADIALIKADKSDKLGNLIYSKTARNFNPAMAMAAKITIAQVDEVVPSGDIDPECVVTQHIFVDAIVKGGR